MRHSHCLSVSVAALLLVVPAGSESLRAQTDPQVTAAPADTTLEQAGPVAAGDFVPESQLRGKLHTVRSEAENDGLNNTYYLETPQGLEAVTGTPALLVRIREVYALDHLQRLSKTEEFGKALAKTAEAKVQSAIGVVRDPIGTMKNVPKGASRFFGRVGESLKGGRSREEGGNPLAGITGVDKAKARLAAKLKVSPYTTNEDLQRELTATARAVAGGGLAISAATSLASGGAGAALTAVGVNQTLQETLVNSTPEDLRMKNRKSLLALGADRAQADEFLMHPWYSPWHETIITEALERIGVNPGAFLAAACRALTEEDAFYFQRLAQILARYHSSQKAIRSIRIEQGIVCAVDGGGTVVVPLSCDYAIWAERAARRVNEFASASRPNGEDRGLALWIDGKASERLAKELATRKITLKTGALQAE